MKHILFLSLILFFIPFRSADAHTLEKETTVGAILHVTPEDDPIAGEISTLSFEVTDTTNRFDPNLCECVVTISENDIVVATIPVYGDSSGNDTALSVLYTFPRIGVYQVTLSGKPGSGSQFEEFSFSYDVRVARERDTVASEKTQTETVSAENTPQRQVLFWTVIVTAVGFLILLIVWKKRRKS